MSKTDDDVIHAGDDRMADGDAHEGGANLTDRKLLIKKTVDEQDRKYVFKNEPGFINYVFVNGVLKAETNDYVKVRDYDGGGLLRHGSEVTVLSVNENNTTIIVPFTVALKDHTKVNGTLEVEVRFERYKGPFSDHNHYAYKFYDMVANFGMMDTGGLCQYTRQGLEQWTFLSGKGLSLKLQNCLANSVREPLSDTNETANMISQLKNLTTNALRENGQLTIFGIRPVYAEVRFSPTDSEILAAHMTRNEYERQKLVDDHLGFSLKVELARQDYEQIEGA